MALSSRASHAPAGVEVAVHARRQVLVLLALLVSRATLCDARSVSESCCGRQPSRACRLYALLLCAPGSGAGGALGEGDASLGILTLGRREAEEQHYHSRLQQLLRGGGGGGGGTRNQAAGILTMGKRAEEEDAVALLMQWAQEDFTT